MVILPLNNLRTVARVIRRFNLSPDDNITITGTNKTFLNPDMPITIFNLLMTSVELSTPASQKQIQMLAESTPENDRSKLLDLTKDDTYKTEVLPKRFSIL